MMISGFLLEDELYTECRPKDGTLATDLSLPVPLPLDELEFVLALLTGSRFLSWRVKAECVCV